MVRILKSSAFSSFFGQIIPSSFSSYLRSSIEKTFFPQLSLFPVISCHSTAFGASHKIPCQTTRSFSSSSSPPSSQDVVSPPLFASPIKKNIRLFVSDGTDILENLAFENYVIDTQEAVNSPTLFLWSNPKTVVIGRHQNPWKECNLSKMEEDGVVLARRYTGGGAVYQDFGNSCFTFLSNTADADKSQNSRIILAALKNSYGIHGEMSGRNDLTVDGRKFSGSAYKQLGNRFLHHGTIMRDVNLRGLEQYLTPHKLKLQSKGISSVASRVANLKEFNNEITHDGLVSAVIREFCESHGFHENCVQAEHINCESSFTSSPIFQKHLETLRRTPYATAYLLLLTFNTACLIAIGIATTLNCYPSDEEQANPSDITHSVVTANVRDATIASLLQAWDWRFGRTPSFSHFLECRFDWGLFEVHLDVKNGVIENCKIFSDCLYPELVETFTDVLTGTKYSTADVRCCVMNLIEANKNQNSFVEEFGNWLAKNIDS